MNGSTATMLCWCVAMAISIAAGTANAVGGTSRGREPAPLPDWTGQWQIVGVTPDPSGGIVQSFGETLATMRIG